MRRNRPHQTISVIQRERGSMRGQRHSRGQGLDWDDPAWCTGDRSSANYKTSGEGIECMSYSCRRMPPPPSPHEHTHMHNTEGIDKGRERDWKRK